MKILIKSDVFNICNRVKSFDSSYRVVYDLSTNKYQIYSTRITHIAEEVGFSNMSYVCTLPYEQLDERSIRYLYDTKIENVDEYIKQIDKHNQKLEYESQTKVKNESLKLAEDKLRQLTK